MMNKVMLIGNIGQITRRDEAKQFCTFSAATNETYKNKDGKLSDHVEWHRIICFGRLAVTCCKYLNKGMQVYIEGKIHYSSYDKDGTKVYTTEINAHQVKFLSKKEDNSRDPYNLPPAAQRNDDFQDGDHDSIPF